MAGVAILACLTLIVAAAAKPSATLVASREMTTWLDGPERTVVIGPIDLPDASTAVKVSASASGLDNSWVDLDYSLVRRGTQASYDAYGLVESYRGTDSDGAWSEGDSDPSTAFAAVERGQYDLVIDYAAHRWTGAQDYVSGQGMNEVPVRIMVYRGAGFASNFLLALALILIVPLVFGWRNHRTGRGH